MHIDGLTEIANRRYFDQYLATQWKRLQREKQTLSLIIIDIDYFKRYNDTYGHLVGDKTIKLVAKTLTNSIKRSSDLAARYGGEEFAIILPNTNTEGAKQVANKIAREMAQLAIIHQNSLVNPYVTLSMGISTMIPNPEQNPQTLINQADNALYSAKNQGRNCIVIA